MNYSTYRLVFEDGTFYVGSTKNTYRRFHHHKSRCKIGTHRNNKLQTAWRTFGEPDLQVLNYYASKEEALEAEQELLNEYFGTDECLNLSSSSKTFWDTETHKANMSKPKSAEHKAKLSAIHKGKPKSPEHKEKISLANSKSITIGALTFPSITEASKHFQVSQQAITLAVKRGSFRGMKVEKVK